MVTILLGLFWNGMVGAFCHYQTPISFSEFWNGRGTVICMWQQNGPSTTKQALRDEEIKQQGCWEELPQEAFDVSERNRTQDLFSCWPQPAL